MTETMTPFLKQVADHYMAEGGISRRCFVFPNRRSQVFFMKYLGELVKEKGVPVVAPESLAIDDFFNRLSKVHASDRVDLLLELYRSYSELNRKAEPLDEFVFWGDVILADFDDVDKYLVDAAGLFANVSDFKAIQDSYSYLTPVQAKAVENFISHFRNEGRLTVRLDSDSPNVKERFLQIWNLLYPLYCDFRTRLAGQGKAYAGMIYRDLAERLREESAVDVMEEAFPDVDGFVFVGLNALNECEKVVLRKMRDARIAEFCWDWCSSMVKDPLNKSSFFMARNVEDFPPAFDLEKVDSVPELEVVSIPSSVGQAKLLPELLKDDGCAVILPDETLLVPVLNSIPPEIKDINVTMGFPMKNSSFFDFLRVVTAMQMHLRRKDGQWLFYHRQVWEVFSSNIFRLLSEGDEELTGTIARIKADKKYYVPQQDLAGHPLLELVFCPAVTDPKSVDSSQTDAIALWLRNMVKGLAPRFAQDPTLAMELEFARAAYKAAGTLHSKHLSVLPATWLRLLDQLLSPVSVPFNGEPLKGLQIMGPLETRSLDFKKVVILSCNEGCFPRRSVSSSFIPPELRKGFSLPTYEYQDAVWAYYFYRLIQRAEKVTMIYDSRTEGLKKGEESRYIKQLEYHFGLPVKRRFARSGIPQPLEVSDIVKTEEDVETIRSRYLSASSLKNYLDCPAKFYYSFVKRLKKRDEVSEDLDAGMLGNAFHKTMQAIYDRPKVTRDYLRSVKADRNGIKSIVRPVILDELKALEVTGRDLVVEDVVIEYVIKTIERDLELLETAGSDAFDILGLEQTFKGEYDGFRFLGIVDRLDSLRPGEARIVDYKTGKVEDADVDINDSNAESIVSALFGEDNNGRPKIAFQLFLYDLLCQNDSRVRDCRLVNSVYPPAGFFSKPVREDAVSQEFVRLTKERLSALLAEMVSLEIPFHRTSDEKTCSYCDFRMICGR